MNKKKYILVTGGCGFIGSNFVNKLIDYKKILLSLTISLLDQKKI